MIETFDPAATQEERIERRRQALLADLFLTGSNAVTESGMLVNLDMVGIGWPDSPSAPSM